MTPRRLRPDGPRRQARDEQEHGDGRNPQRAHGKPPFRRQSSAARQSVSISEGARQELVARDLIAYEDGIYQVLDLPTCSPRKMHGSSSPLPDHASRLSSSLPPVRRTAREAAADMESAKQLLERWGWGRR